MAAGDLTTRANVKQWLNITGTIDDSLLDRMLSAASGFIQTWIDRQIATQIYTERRDGMGMGEGRYAMMFTNSPVTAVQSVTIDGFAVPASPDGGILQPGYSFDDRQIWLAQTGASGGYFPSGYYFTRGKRNVVLNYTAGYLRSDVATIPTTPFQITASFPWTADKGVTFVSNGAVLTAVTGAPAASQYSVANSLYTFAAADVGKQVSMAYSYTPFEVEQAVINLIGLRYREKERIGQVSKSIGGEVITFTQKDMSDEIRTLLSQYKRVVPL